MVLREQELTSNIHLELVRTYGKPIEMVTEAGVNHNSQEIIQYLHILKLFRTNRNYRLTQGYRKLLALEEIDTESIIIWPARQEIAKVTFSNKELPVLFHEHHDFYLTEPTTNEHIENIEGSAQRYAIISPKLFGLGNLIIDVHATTGTKNEKLWATNRLNDLLNNIYSGVNTKLL